MYTEYLLNGVLLNTERNVNSEIQHQQAVYTMQSMVTTAREWMPQLFQRHFCYIANLLSSEILP